MSTQIINNSKAQMKFKNSKSLLNNLKTIKLKMEPKIIKISIRHNLCSNKIITQTKLIKISFSNKIIL